MLNSKGSTLMEVVIILPLFIAGILFILWVGFVVNTNNSLISAVENGVRLASTRGKAGLFQGQPSNGTLDDIKMGALQAIDNYYSSGNLAALGKVKDLLVYNVDESTVNFEDVYSSYITPIFALVADDLPGVVGGKIMLRNLPPYYTYAIAYITKAMRMAVGEDIRYPCDPWNTDGSDPRDGELCLKCRPVNPLTMKDDTFDPAKASVTLLLQRVAIRCDFKPGGYIVRPFLRMLDLLRGETGSQKNSLVLTHFTYFDAFEECFFWPAQDSNVPPNDISRYCCYDRRTQYRYCF